MPTGKIKKSGPLPVTVKIKGNWEVAVKSALAKKRPPEGWPKPKSKVKKQTSGKSR